MSNTLIASVAAPIATTLAIFLFQIDIQNGQFFSSSVFTRFNQWSYLSLSFVSLVICHLYAYYVFTIGKGKEDSLSGHSGPFITLMFIISVIFSSEPSRIMQPLNTILPLLISGIYYLAMRVIFTDIFQKFAFNQKAL